MSPAVAPKTRGQRQSAREVEMSQDRKPVYVGEGLKRALKNAPGSLSTNVNLFADRYMGMVEHGRTERVESVLAVPEYVELLKLAMSNARAHRVEAREVFGFAGIVQGMSERGAPGRGGLLAALVQMRYDELVALIDHLERQP
jgi:hypothetical protein